MSKSNDHRLVLQTIQPGLVGLIDGTLSTLSPIFAAAVLAGSHAALLVGLAASLGAAISMGISEGLSDDGSITGRGSSLKRGLITGICTFIGGMGHSLPFIISDVNTALIIAGIVVFIELIAIALVRQRFLNVSLTGSFLQVTAGGAIIAVLGFFIGHA